jgi:hypothetical protein
MVFSDVAMNTRTGAVDVRSQRGRAGRDTVVMSAAAATGVDECALAFTPKSATPT